MRAHMHRVFAVAVVLVAAIAPALSQGVGVVSGRVTDEQGVPMSGVVVTLSGPGIIGMMTTATDVRGRYWFPGVPGQHPLTITAEAPDRVPMRYIGHTARRDRSIAVDFRLRRPGEHEILVLLEAGVPYHKMALEGALSTMPGDATTFVVSDTGPGTVRSLREHLASRPSAVLAIGESAARLARRHIRDVPTVYSMVPAPLDSDLSTRNMCGVPLNGGFEAQIEHLLHVLPEARRIGTVYDPHAMGQAHRQLKEAASAAGVEIVGAHVHGEDAGDLEQALEALAGEPLDAFFLLLDPRLVSADRFDRITRFTGDRNLVLAVPDPSLAVDENSFAFVPGFYDLGRYSGLLVRRIVEGTAQPSQIGITFPGSGDAAPETNRAGLLTPYDVLPRAEEQEAMSIARDE